jgi:hypothetical protein
MRRFDKKKNIREANLRLEQDFIFERMLMTEIGEAAPYTIAHEGDDYRTVKYEIKTEQYGLLNVFLKIYIKERYSFQHDGKLTDVGIEYMGENDYALEISFSINGPNINMYPTLNGGQAARIMATNRDAINEFINEKHNDGKRLIMLYSSPISDDNDRDRKEAFNRLNRLITDRKLAEREVKDYVRILKTLTSYYEKVRDYILYGEYEMTNDEKSQYSDKRDLLQSMHPKAAFVFLSMFDDNFKLRNLTEKVKREIVALGVENPLEDDIAQGILTKLRDKVFREPTYVENLVKNAERNPRDIDAREGSMRENLYNRTFDEQIKGTEEIAPNPLLKNFVKFKYYNESGIYDKLKAEESKEEKRIADEKEARQRAEREEARRIEREEEEARQRAEEARRNQVLIIKINRNSNLYFKMPNLYKALKSSQIRDKVKINDPINDSITITGVSQEDATEIIRNINSSSLGLNLKHGIGGVELTFGNQPFELN